MPIYTFRNTKTDESIDISMSVAEWVEYVKDNPHMVQKLVPIRTINQTIGGKVKPDNCFRDILTSIKKKNSSKSIPSTINTF